MLVIGILLCLLFIVLSLGLFNWVFDVPILVSVAGLLEGVCLCPLRND